MIGLGELCALSSALCWALGVILMRRSGETLPPIELNLFKNAFSLVLIGLTLLAVQGLVPPDYSASEWLIVLFSGFLGIAVADTFYLKALNLMGASRTGIVSALYTPLVILLSALFLGESLSAWQWAGFGLVMSGILLVTWRRGRAEVDAEAVQRGTLYAAFAMVVMAAGIVMVKEILEQKPFLWTVEVRMLGGLGGMVIFVTLKRSWRLVWARYRQPQPWGTIVTAAFLASYVGILLWLAGYRLIPASVAAILNETNNSFIVFFAWLMLGESINRRKLTGLGLTVLGVLVMLMI